MICLRNIDSQVQQHLHQGLSFFLWTFLAKLNDVQGCFPCFLVDHARVHAKSNQVANVLDRPVQAGIMERRCAELTGGVWVGTQ